MSGAVLVCLQLTVGQMEHLDRRVLHDFLLGKLDPKENRRVVRHLLSGCAPCGSLARELWTGEPVPAEIDLKAIAMKVWKRGRAFDREKERPRRWSRNWSNSRRHGSFCWYRTAGGFRRGASASYYWSARSRSALRTP